MILPQCYCYPCVLHDSSRAVGLDQFTFINAYNSGKSMTPKQCLGDLLNASDVELDSDIFQAATPAKVCVSWFCSLWRFCCFCCCGGGKITFFLMIGLNV